VPRRAIKTPEQVLESVRGGPSSGVFADGSCEGNPGPGGWAWVWVENDQILGQDAGTETQTTNNRMELRALIEAYRHLPEDARLTIHSDSKLCVDTINLWAAGWEKRGWRRKTGPIANLELVQELYALHLGHPGCELRWIKAHEGLRWNEYADALASAYQRS
jgi:ribonuclease HI